MKLFPTATPREVSVAAGYYRLPPLEKLDLKQMSRQSVKEFKNNSNCSKKQINIETKQFTVERINDIVAILKGIAKQ
jgi:hypothetical protein